MLSEPSELVAFTGFWSAYLLTGGRAGAAGAGPHLQSARGPPTLEQHETTQPKAEQRERAWFRHGRGTRTVGELVGDQRGSDGAVGTGVDVDVFRHSELAKTSGESGRVCQATATPGSGDCKTAL